MILKSLLLFCCSIAFLSASSQQPNKSALKKENQIWRNVEAVHKAVFEVKNGDVLKDLLHEKVTYGHSNGSLEDKELMITKATTSTTVYRDIKLERTGLRVVKKTAVVRYILRATSLENDVASPLDLSILQTWVKQKGEWKLLARQAVKIPALQK